MESKGGTRKKIVSQSNEGKHVFDSKAVLGAENAITYLKENSQMWKHQTRAKDYEVVAGKRVGFDATSPRFNYN